MLYASPPSRMTPWRHAKTPCPAHRRCHGAAGCKGEMGGAYGTGVEGGGRGAWGGAGRRFRGGSVGEGEVGAGGWGNRCCWCLGWLPQIEANLHSITMCVPIHATV